MTTTLIDWSLVTDAYISAITPHFVGKMIEIGDHEAPKPANPNDVPGKLRPYLVVDRIPSGRRGLSRGWTGDDLAMLNVRHQVMVYGPTRQLVDRTCAEAVGLTLETDASGYTLAIPVTGMEIMRRDLVTLTPVDRIGAWQAGAIMDFWVCLS